QALPGAPRGDGVLCRIRDNGAICRSAMRYSRPEYGRRFFMTRTIRQSVLLEAPPDALFDTYLDRRGHQAVTGGKVLIAARPGSRFSAFDGMITGRILEVLPKRLIVQRWRSGGWRADDSDSILVLAFSP